MSTFPQTPSLLVVATIVPLTTAAAEFPRIDDRYAERKDRYGWVVQVCNRMAEHRSGLLVLVLCAQNKGGG